MSNAQQERQPDPTKDYAVLPQPIVQEMYNILAELPTKTTGDICQAVKNLTVIIRDGDVFEEPEQMVVARNQNTAAQMGGDGEDGTVVSLNKDGVDGEEKPH